MTSDVWVNLLIQIPLVGAFIWYSLQAQKAYMDSLDKRDSAYEKRNAAIVRSIEQLCEKIDDTNKTKSRRRTTA